jgi:hypothetical protein
MITYEHLRGKPDAFASPTGMAVAVFGACLSAQTQCHQAATHIKRGQKPRRRAPGVGHPRNPMERTRLLMALGRLRVYPIHEVLGLLFHPERGNSEDKVQDVLEALETLADFSFERPITEWKKLGTIVAVTSPFPQVRPVIDAEEQQIERPQGNDRQATIDGRGPASTDHRTIVLTWAAPRRPLLHERFRHE